VTILSNFDFLPSGYLTIVIVQHSAEALVDLDRFRSIRLKLVFDDEPVAQPLVIPLAMIMFNKFMVGEHVAFEAPLGATAWVLLLDMIHHRSQLSSYIRPMGGKHPGIYGPSGDSGS
jgi:hypothetical protein